MTRGLPRVRPISTKRVHDGMDAQDIADEQNLVRLPRRRDDALGGFERVRERLFAEHMRARRERLERHRRVMFGVGANGDRVGLERFSASVRPSQRGRPGNSLSRSWRPRRCG